MAVAAQQGPTAYPREWAPPGAPPPDVEPNVEAVVLAIDQYLVALSDEEFTMLVERVRNGGPPRQQYGQPQQQYGQQRGV